MFVDVETQPETIKHVIATGSARRMEETTGFYKCAERRHYSPMPMSKTYQPPRIRLLAPPGYVQSIIVFNNKANRQSSISGMERQERPRGIGRVPQPERRIPKETMSRPKFRYATEGQEYAMEYFMGNKKKAYDPNGDLVSRRDSPCESLEETFGRKRRGYTLEAKRNQIPVVKNGDKCILN